MNGPKESTCDLSVEPYSDTENYDADTNEVFVEVKSTDVIRFEDLTVKVPSDGLRILKPISQPLKNGLQKYMRMSLESNYPFHVFSGVSGCVKTGEMVLVLGTPGSGKGTFLRAIAGRLNESDILNGRLSINGKECKKNSKKLRRISSYVSDR
eukprot:Pgem_evm1s6389